MLLTFIHTTNGKNETSQKGAESSYPPEMITAVSKAKTKGEYLTNIDKIVVLILLDIHSGLQGTSLYPFGGLKSRLILS